MFDLFEKLTPGHSGRMTSAVIGLSLAAVATSIYLSPNSGHRAAAANQQPTQLITDPSSASPSTTPSPTASSVQASKTPTHPSRPAVTPPPTHPRTQPVYYSHAPSSSQPAPTVTKTVENTVTAQPKIAHCSDFTWQQDAQTAYLANLSDPGALDGARGPHNGDGIACNQLPVDPDRAASIPVDAYTPPVVTATTKASLVSPSAKYFGVAQDGLPGDQGMLDRLAVEVGKAPSSVEWFAGFDSDFPASHVTAAWSRGALPVLTWESLALDPNSGQSSSQYTLTHIVNGDLDDYFYQYAGDIVRTGMPVVLRFDHEMNGSWYPWSAGMSSFNNTPAKYIAAWQHIWQIFNRVGANQFAIWLWAPSRVDNLKPISNGKATGQTNIVDDYPGDGYVDWIGASAYLRTAVLGSSYDATFGKTVSALKAVSNKPIFIAETAAIQADSSGDLTGLKASWTSNAIAGFLADPRIVGFTWFNNDKSTMQDNGVELLNDWRVDSSAPVLAAFKQAVAGPQVAGGTMPDGR